ncbi:hypothetical protein B0H10DRAFT_1960549 [Mycena sp. CBHHK59/15]|nr:hypothetical protein B0H10DRAFT_1960549 [Mycena sp. CBHHK59/15]
MALRQRRELDSIMETDSQFPGPAENDPPELAIQHAPTLDLQPQIAQHLSEPAHGLPRQQLILSFATTLPMQYTTGSSDTRDSAHPPKKLKLGVAGNARKGKTCALCAHANCSDANTCPNGGYRAIQYDARPLGKTLPARPTLLRSRPEAVGFYRLRWALVNAMLFLLPFLAEIAILVLLGSQLGFRNHQSPVEMVYFLVYCWASSGCGLLFIASVRFPRVFRYHLVIPLILGCRRHHSHFSFMSQCRLKALCGKTDEGPSDDSQSTFTIFILGIINDSISVHTLGSLNIGPLCHLQLRVSVPGGAKKNNANTAGKSGAPRIKERYCNVCNKNINLGNRGEGNWTLHIGGPAHVENVANVKKTRPITNYFSSKPAVASTSTPSTTPASSNSVPVSDPTPSASTSRIIDVDLLVDDVGFDSDLPPHPMDIDPHSALLSRLHIAISTIPSTIPLGCDTDHLTSFSVNPVMLVGPGQDPWEDVVHGVIDAIMYDGGRSKDTVQLSQIICRGELGMTGFANWFFLSSVSRWVCWSLESIVSFKPWSYSRAPLSNLSFPVLHLLLRREQVQ